MHPELEVPRACRRRQYQRHARAVGCDRDRHVVVLAVPRRSIGDEVDHRHAAGEILGRRPLHSDRLARLERPRPVRNQLRRARREKIEQIDRDHMPRIDHRDRRVVGWWRVIQLDVRPAAGPAGIDAVQRCATGRDCHRRAVEGRLEAVIENRTGAVGQRIYGDRHEHLARTGRHLELDAGQLRQRLERRVRVATVRQRQAPCQRRQDRAQTASHHAGTTMQGSGQRRPRGSPRIWRRGLAPISSAPDADVMAEVRRSWQLAHGKSHRRRTPA